MSPRSVTLPVRAGLGAVLLVLAGLMAMHGLGTHGSMGSSSTVTTAPAGHASHGVVREAVASLGDDAHRLAPRGGSGHGHGGHAATDCLVVLSLALLLAGALVVRRTRLADGPPASRTRAGVRRRGRDPDPPDLTRLSVLRC